ncbi:DinB family protein [Paenibacillus assamensis]|uniref:DinB family protein n=1 Tax=Paenibacillus assamensis TaxID=311244 RepID=UPI0004026FB9|nr:DinB family protein [Paenibacillus assamensis]
MTNRDMLSLNDNTQAILQFQYQISCQLLDLHLNGLGEDEYSWRPAEQGLHITFDSGVWRADWPDSESYEIGPPSIAWLSWHIIYWLSMVYNHSFGDRTLQRESVPCFGSAREAIAHIYQLKNNWEAAVAELSPQELHKHTRTNWPFSNKSFYELLAWLNLELMKNAAEIGSCRFLCASQKQEND